MATEPPLRSIVSSSLPVEPLWQIEVDEPVNERPLIVDDVVIVSTTQAIYGLDTVTGQRRWKHPTVRRSSLAPAVAPNKVIYGDRKGQVITLDTATGEVIWQHKVGDTKSRVVDSIIIDNGMVCVATYPTEIEALDLETGEPIWYVNGSDNGIPTFGAKLYLHNNNLYAFTIEVHILDAETGCIKQVIQQDMEPSQLVNGRFYTSQWVRDADTLALISKLESPSSVFLSDGCENFLTPYTFSKNLFYAIGQCGGVYALDIESNEIKWGYHSEIFGESPTATYRSRLYALFDDGQIHTIEPQTGEVKGVLKTNLELPGGVTTASGIVANEAVLIATFNDKNVWAFCENPCF